MEEGSVEIDVVNFEENSQVQFRYDLMDSYIDICTPEVKHTAHIILPQTALIHSHIFQIIGAHAFY